uniref:Y1 n=1 Tax=Arundo donax TaxID=35708 RepID=A0A0A9GB67_ARUDO
MPWYRAGGVWPELRRVLQPGREPGGRGCHLVRTEGVRRSAEAGSIAETPAAHTDAACS